MALGFKSQNTVGANAVASTEMHEMLITVLGWLDRSGVMLCDNGVICGNCGAIIKMPLWPSRKVNWCGRFRWPESRAGVPC